ncbi:unnamed protein product [Cylicocyclus nassatus]|uniref:Uncharacterized protein n=1 Tax=Cylicocyclus nassatus TaxID=53992 RepID=A0AA36H6K0_CYLNA|nr:unnamed protein product [Cylicocyclus nassatus]
MGVKASQRGKNELCFGLTDENVEDMQITGKIPSILLIYNDTDLDSQDIGCILRAAVSNEEIHAAKISDSPCMQLLTIDAKPDELHVIVTHGSPRLPLCDAQVYGAIPNVIEVRFTKTRKAIDYVTFNLIANGGRMRFDVPLDDNTATPLNLLLAFRALIRIVMSGRPYDNGIPDFHRSSHLLANPALGRAKDKFLRKIEITLPFSANCMITYIPVFIFASAVSFLLVVPCGSSQAVQFDSVEVPDDEIRPEQLPSLYGILRRDKGKAGSSAEAKSQSGGTPEKNTEKNASSAPETSKAEGGLNVQPTMSDEVPSPTQRSSPIQNVPPTANPLIIPVNTLDKQDHKQPPKQPLKKPNK